ncbi:hypothetical protein GCWU000341_03001, partial [Oribacterium sp. oral taxon 078 str. F0262]
MYTSPKFHQIAFTDFNQSCGMQLDPKNEWVLLADRLDWCRMEEKTRYNELFPSKTGHPAKPFRMALGSLIIQKRKKLSDRGPVKEIGENSYLQYFIRCESFRKGCPFTAPLLVSFRKRLGIEALMTVNDIFLSAAAATKEHKGDAQPAEGGENVGTEILDATCSPSNIKYPQDFELLHEARILHWLRPKSGRRRRSAWRSAGSWSMFAASMYLTIRKLYEQQRYRYDNKTHQVSDRIVNLSQPDIRLIMRGKAKSPVEFGAKYDVSVDEKGHARLEKISFTPYHEGSVLKDAVERYRKRTGHYPERILADRIYRTRANLQYSKEHGIRMSGPKLGRPKRTDARATKEGYRDNVDRIEVERFFSLDKRCNGAGLIMTRLEETTLSSIALSVFVTNLFA